MMKVVLTWPPSSEELRILLENLRKGVEIAYPLSRKSRFKELLEIVEDADILVGGYVPDEVILRARKLKLIQAITSGVERLNFKLLKERGIILASASGANAISAAEMALALMLTIAKRIVEYDKRMKRGEWVPYARETMLSELYGKTLGIVGLGRVGREIALRAKAFGMRIIAIKKNPEPSLKEELGLDFLGGPNDLDYILSESDYLVISLPITPETRGIIGERELKKMKRGAVLINISRGPIIDEKALLKALKMGRIRAAGLDVWWYYPPDPHCPSKLKIHTLKNVVATPHKAGWTWEARVRALKLAAENINSLLEGKPLKNVVDLNRGY